MHLTVDSEIHNTILQGQMSLSKMKSTVNISFQAT